MSVESWVYLLSQPLVTFAVVALILAFVLLLFLTYVDVHYYLQVCRARRADDGRERSLAGEPFPPVSLIVYARDNADFLRRHLPEYFKQDYPDFEVVVVDDASTDDTQDLLHLYAQQYPRLYSTYVPLDACVLSHRKLAITLGFKAIKTDYAVVIDARCVPSSSYWLRNMMRRFSDGVDLVMGYTRLDMPSLPETRYWVYDRMLFAANYLSCALLGAPYMGEGTNVAYRKSLFFDHKGFSRTLKFRFGEDDLFINETAVAGNSRVEMARDSFVDVRSDDNSPLWSLLKLRYCFTAPYLRHSHRGLFIGEQWSTYLFYVALVVGIVFQPAHPVVWIAALVLLLWRGVMQTKVYGRMADALELPRIGLWVLLYEWGRPVVNLYFALLARWRRRENLM
ncbi:MAG: glycosyltransferase [Porphyromonadaceae bacterium]|nr:glycosyltransferase [Porphyromonadaceae bacterium]